MAGRKRFRSRLQQLASAPAHSWLHAGHYSVGDPLIRVYFLCTPHGPLTINEEYFCWFRAAGHSIPVSGRMAYENGRLRAPGKKERGRIADLIDMDAKGMIDLKLGPWEYYGFEIGNRLGYLKPAIVDYAECLKTPHTSRTVTSCQSTTP